jgi:hypothetical protein
MCIFFAAGCGPTTWDIKVGNFAKTYVSRHVFVIACSGLPARSLSPSAVHPLKRLLAVHPLRRIRHT